MHERPDSARKERAGKAAVTRGSQQSSEEGEGAARQRGRAETDFLLAAGSSSTRLLAVERENDNNNL